MNAKKRPAEVFADPRGDWAFKRLFGMQVHEAYLISFINAVLEQAGHAEITSATIMDPTEFPDDIRDKLRSKSGILDLKCRTKAGEIIVEMQATDQEDFDERL